MATIAESAGNREALPAPARSASTLESLSLGLGAISFVVVALVALVTFRFEGTPIAGPGSVGQFAAIGAGVVAALAFAAGRYIVREHSGSTKRITLLDIADVAALAFAHAVIALLGWTLLADILDESFLGATVYPLPVLLLSGAVAAVTAYVCFFSATHMDLSLLATVLAVFLVFGVLASMLTASDPRWWEDNLSALGMTDDLSAMAFNLTLIVAGFIVTILVRYATASAVIRRAPGIRWVRTLLVTVGVFLGCVGVFPVDDFFALHNTVATGMAVGFVVLVIGMRWWIPRMPRGFLLTGYAFVAVVVLVAIYFATGYYTLTAVELVAGVLVFSWIILFIRAASALEEDDETAATGERS
ncbi:DUF998 domain-containing protein [Microbacterium sp. NIBRBAC000506063]|uniref:DUF998 domain-containing protein n=1 Tax=Microbacterium sp. NIBRBAC000506063 TaxID=2734618 RepID=UPI001BB5281B|nr:DUF998 domain-containing protein [Microbacterium sp. NIBRBAC000506063]QTV78959.1 DUF998 domain-containing protein [Microbacterium sp. NIBRBAC000506063]